MTDIFNGIVSFSSHFLSRILNKRDITPGYEDGSIGAVRCRDGAPLPVAFRVPYRHLRVHVIACLLVPSMDIRDDLALITTYGYTY